MNWEDERYVRLYTRDTGAWCALSWDAQALFMQILRKVDRAGVLQLGKQGLRAVAPVIGHRDQWERIEPALQELLDDGCVALEGDCLVLNNFIEAQEAKQSDKQRQRESRLKRRDMVRTGLDPDAREAVIYFIQSEHGGPIKIGRAEDLAKRLVGLQTSRPDKLVVLAAAKGTVKQERELHQRFAELREKGEWFTASDELLALVRSVAASGEIAQSQSVTGHDLHTVTPCLAVPSREVPSHDEPMARAGAQAAFLVEHALGLLYETNPELKPVRTYKDRHGPDPSTGLPAKLSRAFLDGFMEAARADPPVGPAEFLVLAGWVKAGGLSWMQGKGGWMGYICANLPQLLDRAQEWDRAGRPAIRNGRKEAVPPAAAAPTTPTGEDRSLAEVRALRERALAETNRSPEAVALFNSMDDEEARA